ncbi:hypothetical protein ACEPAG_4685 [Sanghuangporus baumii]
MTTIVIEPEAAVSGIFVVKELTFRSQPGSDLAHIWYTERRGKTLFCVNSSDEHVGKTSVPFAYVKVTNGVDNTPPLEVVHTQIFGEDLPLLKLISCVDFDDANGLLLMSIALGDVRLASVPTEAIISLESSRNDLGIDTQRERTRFPTELDQAKARARRKGTRTLAHSTTMAR